jgi:hypothetical protein
VKCRLCPDICGFRLQTLKQQLGERGKGQRGEMKSMLSQDICGASYDSRTYFDFVENPTLLVSNANS